MKGLKGPGFGFEEFEAGGFGATWWSSLGFRV